MIANFQNNFGCGGRETSTIPARGVHSACHITHYEGITGNGGEGRGGEGRGGEACMIITSYMHHGREGGWRGGSGRNELTIGEL